MPVTTAEAFLAVLEKSRLLSPGQWAQAQASPGRDPQALAQGLIEQGRLSRWQAQQLLAGRHSFFLGKYKLLDKLGEGGMGAVYKAQQTTTGRMVAVKVMSENVVKQPGAVSRFHREIRAVSALHHPNIVAAFDADQVGETHFLVMEYAEGRDLKEWIKEFGKLPIDWSCECIRQAALGLQHAHERGLAHRDIKPSNLLVVSNDVGGIPQVKILDMGLARFTSETQCTVLTQTGQVLGTIDYISPEQAKDTKGAGIQADIFSLGASLFHMITGQVPFLGKSPMEKLMARAMRDAPRASTLSPAIPPALDAIIAKMLARKPGDRFQTPDEVVAALEPFCLGAMSDRSSSLTLPKTAETAGSTIEAEADQTLNHFLGTLESGPAEEEEPIHVKGDEARLRPTNPRGPGFDPRRLKAKWIALAAALLLIGIGMLWWGSSGKPKQIDVPREPPLAVSPLDAKQAREVQVAWARHLGVQADLTNSIGMKFRLIPPGEFLMGTSSADLPRLLEMAKRNGEGWETTHIPAETPQHRVRIARPFFLGIYEVKNSQFQKFVAAGNGAEGWKPVGPSADPEMPAGGASYEQMTEFCKWLGERDQAIYRLPTEAEWEYACRAGTITPFAFGDSLSSTQANFNGEFPFGNGAKGPNRGVATKAGSFAANAWGLYDMHGNVWETCSDWYAADAYRNHAALDPTGPVTGTIHVTRGADYENSRGVAVRSATHFGYPLPYYSVGFRVVREVEQLATAQRKPPISGELSPYAVFTSPDYQWTAPENLGPVVNSLSDEGSPCLSADGLTLLFDSGRSGGHGHGDLWLCRRPTPTAPWSAPENLGATVNLQSSEMNPSLSADGLTLAFASDRGAPPNEFHLWMCTRATPGDPWSPVKKLDPSLDAAGASDAGPEQSADGLSLLFHSDGRPGLGGNDLWWCRRRTKADPWGTPENLGPTVNSKHEDVALALSSDGRVLVFASKRSDGKRKDLWWSSRPSLDAPWSAAQKFGAPVSSVFEANAPTLSADGRTMIFASYDRSGGQGKWDLWISRRVLKNSATGIAKTSAMDDPARWKHAINLLPLVNPAKDRVGGEWAIANGEIVCTKPATATLEIPYQPAREYEFRIDFTVRSGTPQVNQFLAREGTAWSFIMGSSSNTFVGFEMIDGRSVDENPTLRRQKLRLGHRYTAVVRVSDAETVAWLDGVETARWKTNYGDLGLDHPKWNHWKRRDRSVLAIGALGSVVDFHQLAVLELTGRGVFTRPDDAAAKEADTKRSAAAEKYVNALGMEFVRVPKGRSWLGGGGGKPGTQEVTIAEDFYLGKFEVTQEDWEKVMGTNPSGFKTAVGLAPEYLKRFPVENVSWDDAQSFLGKLNERDKQAGWEYRLPTSSEWEYACRGGPLAAKEESSFDFYLDQPASTLPADKANFVESGWKRPQKVGSYPPNRLGLHDMHGNVYETCHDAAVDAKGNPQRYSRGGSFLVAAPVCRASVRGINGPAWRHYQHGLRLARVPVAAANSSTAWQPLFNGKDLSGWTGNLAAWTAADDKLNTVGKGASEWLLSERTFSDFTLRVQVWSAGNSGIQLKAAAGGLEVEIDAGASGTTGRFDTRSDQRIRNATRNAFRPREWNDFELVRHGSKVSLTINGETVNEADPQNLPELAKLTGPVRIGLESYAGSCSFREIRIFETSAAPIVPWQPLFNGKDLTGLTQRSASGVAQVIVEVGEPVLRLQDRSNLTTRRVGDYHLRLEFRPEKGAILSAVSDSGPRLTVDLGSDLTNASLLGTEMTYESATIQSGRFIGSGQTIDSKQHPFPNPRGRLIFTNPTLNPNSPWQRLEIIRIGDSCAVLLNGKLTAAATNIRIARTGEPAKVPGATEIGLTAYGGTASYRNIELREINALPSEIVAAAAWQPLFNGKDLTGLTKTNPAHNTGMADVVEDDGQPALRLTKPYGLETPAFGNYHLRFQTKSSAGVGGVYHVFAGGIGLYLRCEISGKSAALIVAGHGSTYQEAKLRNGQIVAVGARVTRKEITFAALPADPGWLQIEILRLDDSFVYLLNGKVAGAITRFRDIRKGTEELLGRTPIEFWALHERPALFRNMEIREIDALPTEILAQTAWQPLFNGRDLEGWSKSPGGKAEFAVEDGQPILRLSEPVVLVGPQLGDYHLRFERKVEAGAYGGGLHLCGASSRFEFRLGNRTVSQVCGTHCTYQPAEIQAGRFVAVGKPLGDNTPFDLAKDSLGTPDAWQRIEVLRLGDSFALVINGKPAGAFTNVRFLHDGKVQAPGPRQPITLWAFGGPISFRNMEFRQIDSLPPEPQN